MATISNDVFKKFQQAKKLPTRQQGDGSEVEVEVREDEEQSIKLQEIIDLLVAAGYFRARIKGLSPFDKIVGGMTWCIEFCNVDVDVDLLFEENSTIGQKIALTEKIVVVLPKLQCPHHLEPHQIQGLDFIHIFPVIQWLVKRSMEFREEMSQFVRSYAVNQFNKEFQIDTNQSKIQANVLKNVRAVNDVYRPHRYYKRKNAPLCDILSQVQVTLLEYGHRTVGDAGNVVHDEKVQMSEKESQKQMEELLNNLTIAQEETVNLENLTEEELKNLEKHYSALQSEFRDGGIKSREEQQIKLLQNQKSILSEKYAKLHTQKEELDANLSECTSQIQEIKQKQSAAEEWLKQFEQTDAENVREVEDLVLMNETLRKQESQFRDYCKKELVRLQTQIEETKQIKATSPNKQEDDTDVKKITEDVATLRLQLGKKNRIVAALQRHIDDVPNRPELAQYQRRFLELYNQVSAKHKETKQYFTLFNTLEDTRLYMQKELSLLNSISDNYPEAMQSNAGKEEFLNQFQKIVDGVKQSKQKVESRLTEEKRKRDQQSSTLQILIDQQRKYVNAVRQLSIECKKHESLLAQQQK